MSLGAFEMKVNVAVQQCGADAALRYIIIALAFYVKPEGASGNLGSSFFANWF